MNKFLCFLVIFFLFISCSKTSKKGILINEKIDYKSLNSFIKDSLPSFRTFDESYNEIFNLWEETKVIKSSSELISKEARQLSFFLDNLKIEIVKVNDKRIFRPFNIPQVIGRFRVYKTNILKINSNKIDSKNIRLFKNDLKSIVISYNALINTMNKVAKESIQNNKETIILDE